MKTYCLKIKPQGSFLTPWQADTLFGSLCWIMAWREGEEALALFLQQYKDGKPPFILSDGFPGDFLPAPAHLALAKPKGNSFQDYQESKKLKKVTWLTSDEFDLVRKGTMDIATKGNLDPVSVFTTLHSSINRITGTTGDEGSLFELEEYALKQKDGAIQTVSIYLRITDGWEEKVFSLFKDLSTLGYGKKKSIGKGSFQIAGELEPRNQFDDFIGSNGFVSLSNFVPARTDPTEGFYKTLVKYGKLGGEYAFCGNPFKKPLLMLTAGSSFYVKTEIQPYYGRMIDNIALGKPEVVQYGYAFAVPCTFAI